MRRNFLISNNRSLSVCASDGDSQDEAGNDHPSTLTSMNNLASTWKAQGQDTKAIQLMTDCVQRTKRILGVKHPSYLTFSQALTKWQAGNIHYGQESSSINT
jgi:hypothetical protein